MSGSDIHVLAVEQVVRQASGNVIIFFFFLFSTKFPDFVSHFVLVRILGQFLFMKRKAIYYKSFNNMKIDFIMVA